MIQGAQTTIYRDFDASSDEIVDHDLLFIVDPSTGVLTQVIDYGHKGIVDAVTSSSVDMTHVSTLIGFNVNPWENDK